LQDDPYGYILADSGFIRSSKPSNNAWQFQKRRAAFR